MLIRRNHLLAVFWTVSLLSPAVGQQVIDAASVPKLALDKPTNHGGLHVYAVSEDGKKVAGGSWVGGMTFGGKSKVLGGEVFLWDRKKGRITKVLGKHDKSPTWLEFSADGKTLVSYSEDDYTIKVWKTSKSKPLAVIKTGGPCSAFDLPVLSRDGKTLVHLSRRTLSEEAGLKAPYRLEVWDLAKKQLRWKIEADAKMDGLDSEYAISPDSKRVMVSIQKVSWTVKDGMGTGAHGASYQAMFDLMTGKEIWRVDLEENDEKRPHPDGLMRFTPDGKEVVAVDWSRLDRYDASTGKHLATVELDRENSIEDLIFDRSGKRFLVVRMMSQDMEWYSFPKCELEYRTNFDLKGVAASGDLTRVAGLQRFEPVLLDLSKALK